MSAHELSVNKISELLTYAKVDTTKCILMHPTDDTILSFDMLSGNKRFMFSDGRSYFTDILQILSLNRIIECAIIRCFFDSYTGKDALSDRKKMDNETRFLFKTDKTHLDLHRLFISDIKRMMRRGMEKTMYSIQDTCNVAQRTLIQALHFNAVLNMVPCKSVIPKEGEQSKKRPQNVTAISTTGYAYEHYIAQACMTMGQDVHMTHSMPPQEDTIVIFDTTTKKASAFLYEQGKLHPLKVFFFGAVSHETFTRRQHMPFVQTHSLCENVIPLERYLHEMESMHMKVVKELAFRSTVIVQNAEDCEGHIAKKSRIDNNDNSADGDAKAYIANATNTFKKDIDSCLQPLQGAIQTIANGSKMAEHVPLSGRNVTEAEIKNSTTVDAFGNNVSADSASVLKLVHDLQSKHGPIGGRDVDKSLAYIESGTSNLQRTLTKQQEHNLSLNRALAVSQRTHSTMCYRNKELVKELLTEQNSNRVQTRQMSRMQMELDAAQANIEHMRRKMPLEEEETCKRGGSSDISLRVNCPVDAENNNDYNVDLSQANNMRSIRYVNVSDSTENRMRYLNANFSVPPVDKDIREAARKAWENEVKSRFFLRDHVYTSTGNQIERQPSPDTTSVYIGEFCTQFMGFRMMGRIALDSSFWSKVDTVEHMFACESDGTAIDLVNEIQS